MKINKLITFLFCILYCNFSSFAAINVAVHIAVNDSIAINECDLCVSETSQIVYFAKLTEPYTTFELQRSGNYSIILSQGSGIVCGQNFFIDRDTTLTLDQDVKSIELNDIVVISQSLPKTTATGQIFKLTDDAKNSGDPFRALSEIPLLNVDISGQSIKTNEGEMPLILIDGKYINSGIAPIDPKFIESVEIIEVVNAKYLQMGVSKIIDIHLKRNVPLYTFVDFRTRHDIPLREGFGAANFEFGTTKFAISGSISGSYMHDDKVSSVVSETSGANNRHIDLKNISRSLGYDGDILFKWVPKTTEYFAGVIKTLMSYDRINGNGQGVYNGLDYTSTQKNRLDQGGWLGAVYYEHTFNDDGNLSAFAKYNRGISNVEDNRADVYINDGYANGFDYWEYEKSLRDQYTLTIDYNGAEHDYGSFSGGNNFEYTHDTDYDRTVNPNEKANVKLTSNYSYLSYYNMWKNIFAMGSVGLQYMHIQTDKGSNHWWRPRIAATAGLKLPKSSNIRLAYNLDNELPLSSQLFTFNHSTNPWLKVEGNPYLVPVEKHNLTISYDKYFSKFNIRLFSQYNQYRNMIEQFVTNEDDYSIQSYRNNGSWRSFKTGGIFTFRKGNIRATFKIAYQQEKYHHDSFKGIVELGGNLRWDFNRFFIYSDIMWQDRSYTAISSTKYINPSVAHVQIAWQATKNIYLSVGLPYFWGVRKETIEINQGNYSSMTKNSFNSASLRPWLLISWTIRKNKNQSIEDRMPID